MVGRLDERGVSYYGCTSLRHVVEDFKDMIEHGCNAVLLGVSEFDCGFWYRSLVKVVEVAKWLGLRVYWDFWGWGKVFGGEPPSLFLQRHCKYRQVDRLTNEPLPAACFNTEEFKSYFWGWVRKVASETDVDGIFLDEPHYYFRGRGWSCACPRCRREFKERYGEEMPKELNQEVVRFREDKLLEFLKGTAKAVKEADPSKDVIVCLLPREDPLVGLINWEEVAKIKEIDCLASDPYWLSCGEPVAKVSEVARRVVDIAKRYGKRSQLWLQAFKVPRGREGELVEAAKQMIAIGVDSLFAWCYKGGEGSAIASEDPLKVWEILGEIFASIS